MSKAVAKRVPTPKPVTVKQVCDVCDEDWAEHPKDATVMDCLEIVKSKKQLHTCCGHGHTCCHTWHFHWHQPIQWSYTPGIFYDTVTTTNTIGSISATKTVSTPSLSNALQYVS